MVLASLAVVAVLLTAVAVWVLLARPQSAINQWFAAYTFAIAGWTISIGYLHAGQAPEVWSRLAFLSSSFIPACFLAFTRVFPSAGPWPSERVRDDLVGLATSELGASLRRSNAALFPISFDAEIAQADRRMAL